VKWLALEYVERLKQMMAAPDYAHSLQKILLGRP